MFISLSKSGGNFGVELWETPVGQVIEGMEVVKQFYSGYGDMPPVSVAFMDKMDGLPFVYSLVFVWLGI
jgi:hypothetical protein